MNTPEVNSLSQTARAPPSSASASSSTASAQTPLTTKRPSYTLEEREEALRVLASHIGNKALTSRLTGVSRSTLLGWARSKPHLDNAKLG